MVCSEKMSWEIELRKVTSFTKYVSGCGESGRIMMDNVCDEVEEITSIKERFAVNVRKEIIKHDISEKKLRNAVGLEIVTQI